MSHWTEELNDLDTMSDEERARWAALREEAVAALARLDRAIEQAEAHGEREE